MNEIGDLQKLHGNTGNRYAAKYGENADSFLHARCLRSDKAIWVKAAQKEGMKLTEWIIGRLNNNETCAWVECGIDAGSWDSACGEKWLFAAGTPAENGVKFCHNCGKKLQ